MVPDVLAGLADQERELLETTREARAATASYVRRIRELGPPAGALARLRTEATPEERVRAGTWLESPMVTIPEAVPAYEAACRAIAKWAGGVERDPDRLGRQGPIVEDHELMWRIHLVVDRLYWEDGGWSHDVIESPP